MNSDTVVVTKIGKSLTEDVLDPSFVSKRHRGEIGETLGLCRFLRDRGHRVVLLAHTSESITIPEGVEHVSWASYLRGAASDPWLVTREEAEAIARRLTDQLTERGVVPRKTPAVCMYGVMTNRHDPGNARGAVMKLSSLRYYAYPQLTLRHLALPCIGVVTDARQYFRDLDAVLHPQGGTLLPVGLLSQVHEDKTRRLAGRVTREYWRRCDAHSWFTYGVEDAWDAVRRDARKTRPLALVMHAHVGGAGYSATCHDRDEQLCSLLGDETLLSELTRDLGVIVGEGWDRSRLFSRYPSRMRELWAGAGTVFGAMTVTAESKRGVHLSPIESGWGLTAKARWFAMLGAASIPFGRTAETPHAYDPLYSLWGPGHPLRVETAGDLRRVLREHDDDDALAEAERVRELTTPKFTEVCRCIDAVIDGSHEKDRERHVREFGGILL